MNVLAIGSKRFITFFKLFGFMGLLAEDKNSVISALKGLSGSYGLIVIDRSVIKGSESEIDEISMNIEPPVLALDPPYEVYETAEAVEKEIRRVMKVF